MERYPYRVFVSYAAEDRPHAERIVARLKALRLQPVWDRDNYAGWSFLEDIKRHIAHSHLFVPLLTRRSVQSTWVNHEIGFAVGRNVPVLPLSLGPMPGGMAGALHADVGESVDDLLPRLTRKRIDALVEAGRGIEVYEFADDPGSRTRAIISHCSELANLGFAQGEPVRHRAPFSSFSLPASADDPIWRRRYHGETHRGDRASRRELSEERRLLEKHALEFGCDLLLYPTLRHLTPTAIAARIEILRDFLETMHQSAKPVRIIFNKAAHGGNVLIVGDWFCAESITPQREGYRHTTLTSHARTVLDRIEQFDKMFELLGEPMSARQAIAWLDKHQAKCASGGLGAKARTAARTP